MECLNPFMAIRALTLRADSSLNHVRLARSQRQHPQGNGQVERTNRTLIGLLKGFTKDAQLDDWDLSLGRVLSRTGLRSISQRAFPHSRCSQVLK